MWRCRKKKTVYLMAYKGIIINRQLKQTAKDKAVIQQSVVHTFIPGRMLQRSVLQNGI